MADALAVAAAATGGGDSYILFNGDYSFASVVVELLKFFFFWLTGVAGGAAGGAGGSLFIPVLLSPLFEFHVYALPLSRAAVFGMATAFTLQNARRGQQAPPAGYLSVFAWDVIVLMEPMSLLGTSVGVRINKMCPQWFIVLLMVGTLSYSAVETWKKAIKRRAEEFKRDDSLSARGAPSALSTTVASVRSARGVSASPLAASWRPASDSGAIGALKLPTPAQQRSPILFVASKAERHVPAMRLPGAGSASVSALGGSVTPLSMSATALAQSESSSTVVSGNSRSDASIAVSEAVERHADLRMPISMARCCASVGVCWALLLVLNIALGGSGQYTRSGIECGSALFYALWLCVPPAVILSVTLWNAMHMRASEARRDALGVTLPREQIKWTTRNLVFYSTMFCFAGAIGAMAGVGGSTIKGPLLIQFGLDPIIAQSSSQFMLLTTISSTMIQYMALNMLPSGYGAVFFILGLTSGTLGKSAMDWVVQKRKQTSLIVFALSIYTVAAVVSMSWISIAQIIADWREQKWERFAFQHMCAALPGRSALLQKR